MQVQVVIELTEGRSSLLINQLAREDARPDERAFAQAIEDLLLSVNHFASEQAGMTVTEERIGPVPAETAEEAEVARLRAALEAAQALETFYISRAWAMYEDEASLWAAFAEARRTALETQP